MDADGISLEDPDNSDFSGLYNTTETLWDASDEEDEECDAEHSPVVQEGRRLWVHAEGRHGKASSRWKGAVVDVVA